MGGGKEGDDGGGGRRRMEGREEEKKNPYETGCNQNVYLKNKQQCPLWIPFTDFNPVI